MDSPSFLYRISGALDTTADELAELTGVIDDIRAVIEGSRQWSDLGHCRNRIDVHARSLRRLAERCRRLGEPPSPNPPAKGATQQ